MRTFFNLLLAGMVLSSAGCNSKQVDNQETPTKPNYIIFFTDDLGYNDIECFGAPRIKTPNLNKMAEEGIKFTNFYAQPVCGPSRAALLTGAIPYALANLKIQKVFIQSFIPRKLPLRKF